MTGELSRRGRRGRVEEDKDGGDRQIIQTIRLAAIEYPPEIVRPHLEKDQYPLYKLIWDRFVSCQVQPARYDQTTFDVVSGDHAFRASGSIDAISAQMWNKISHQRLHLLPNLTDPAELHPCGELRQA